MNSLLPSPHWFTVYTLEREIFSKLDLITTFPPLKLIDSPFSEGSSPNSLDWHSRSSTNITLPHMPKYTYRYPPTRCTPFYLEGPVQFSLNALLISAYKSLLVLYLSSGMPFLCLSSCPNPIHFFFWRPSPLSNSFMNSHNSTEQWNIP